MAAHLTRCALHTLPMFTPKHRIWDNSSKIIDFIKCGFASFGRAVTTLFLKSVCYTYDFILL